MKSKWIIIAIICIAVAAIAVAGVLFFAKNKPQAGTSQVSTQADSETGTVKIACVGDSITFGYALENREKDAYPAQLQAMLGNDYEVKNFGVTGRTVSLSGDYPYILEEAFEQSKAFTPDIVLLMLGTNDTKKSNWNQEQFANDYAFLVESYRGLPNHPQVYVMTPPPLYMENPTANAPRAAVMANEVVPFVREFAKKEEVPLMDVFAAFENKKQWLSDGCHPNAQGAKHIAQLAQQQIEKQ